MAFSFGNSSGSPAKRAAPGPSPAFSFGGGAPAPAAAPTTAAPTPASGFSFGGSVPGPAAPAPVPGISFGGSAPAPAVPAPASGFSLGGSAPAPASTVASSSMALVPASTALVPVAVSTQTTLTAPDFDAAFDNINLWEKIKRLCTETFLEQQLGQNETNMSLAGQDLVHFVSTRAVTSLKPRVVDWTPPNMALRQQLAQKPLVGWEGSSTTTSLTTKVLDEIGRLSTDLRISEAEATSLYKEVTNDYNVIHGLLTSKTDGGGGAGFVDQALEGASNYDDVSKLTRDFYFYERHLKLESILYLIEQRMSNNPAVVLATDSLLKEGQVVTTLISVIREYTQRIEQLQQEILSGQGGAQQHHQQQYQQQPLQQQQPHISQFAKVHLLFCTQERQTAAEILFLIAYHTQLEVPEVTGLIDLVRDLSAKTPKLSPFKDVPSPYEAIDSMNTSYNPYGGGAAWAHSAGYPQWDRKTKNPLDWEKELVRKTSQSGQPKLLQCYSLVLVAAMAAMDTRQELYDRDLHGPNEFGRGNQLLHPTQPSLENIKGIHNRLKPEACKEWARPDVWGLLACSYALLLRLTPTVIMSPTKGGSNSAFSKEVREAAKYCMEEPAGLMSFTFCRLTLVPALQKVKSTSMRAEVNISEFCLAVVSETYSLYLSVLSEGTGNLPISRKRWQDREEEDLKLQRQQYENQVKFEYYMGNTDGSAASKQNPVPTGVDLMERHECLDDLIGLATTLCSLGPCYARNFWAKKGNGTLVPSRTLLECMVKASTDESLLPYVYSWMAALSNDEESASAIHRIMSGENSVDGIAAGVTSWYTVVDSLRFYVQHLSNNSDNNLVKPSSPAANSSTRNNTSYYYNLEGNVPDPSTNNRSRGGSGNPGSSSGSSKKSMKPQELSEASKLRVASYLALIMNVSLHCFDARYNILSINLPLVEGDIAAGGDESLVVLFKLAIAPLSPQMRGATLSTIASLLHSTEDIQDAKVKSFMEEQGNNAWEYLECCSLLPINLLDRYRVVVPSTDNQDQAGLSFPPTSMALASSAGQVESTIPKHPMYGLLYELDHIESKKGWYPSTEGFLDLLKSLVSSVGCPSKLGEKLRVRTGCTPYLEYVIHFVLPKALGVNHHSVLPFRVPGDRSRLVSRALAVVESVIIRYQPPTLVGLNPTKAAESSPLSVLGIRAVVDKIETSSDKIDANEILSDFMSLTASATLLATGENYPGSTQVTNQPFVGSSSVSSVPVPKSPAFTILVELLSSSCGVLLQSLAVILTECGGPDGVLSVFGEQSDKMDMTYALYSSTPPDLNSAKEGLKEDGPTKPLQNLLKSFAPKFQNANIDDQYIDDSVIWRETSIASALHILCAAATREDAFIAALMASKEQPLKLVPVLEFKELKPGSGNALTFDNMKARDVQLSRLTELLFSVKDSRYLRSTIVEYVSYGTAAIKYKTEIPAAALSIVYRMQKTMPPQTGIRSLSGDHPTTAEFSKAIAGRLVISSKNFDRTRDSEVVTLILNWILSELRTGVIANNGLAHILLGLPGDTNDGNWKPQCGHYSGAISDCFDAILDIRRHNDMSGNIPGISSLSFEIFFRLHNLIKARDPTSLKIAIYTAERLRAVDFWRDSILKMPVVDLNFMNRDQFVQTLHSMGWLLKGLACELRLLVGFQGDPISQSVFGIYLEQHPVQCNQLLSTLYGSESGVMINLLDTLPMDLLEIDASVPHPPREAIAAAVCDLPVAEDIVQGYQIIDSTKVISIASARRWIEDYNFISARNCAVSHVTSALSVLLDASMYSAESMSRCHTPLLHSSNFSDSWLHSNGPQDLLVKFLRRLQDVPNIDDYSGMDSVLVPVATRNWSNMILTVSEFITTDPCKVSTKSSDLLQIAALIARVIPFSSIGNDTAEEAAFRFERTASLGSALAQLLRSSASLEPEFAAQYRDDFIGAAHGLARISGFKVESRDTGSHGIISMLARGCMASIIFALSEIENESKFEKSYASSCIPQEFLERSVSLLADLDEDICNFLQAMALQPSGTKMLIDAGIERALLSAATKYAEQERAVVRNLEETSSRFSKTTIRTPVFLLGHLKLMCALLSTSDLPEELAVNFASRCLEVVGVYDSTIQRLCYEFPVQADVLRLFLKVLVSASSIAKPLKKKNQIKKLGPNTEEMISRARFLENGVAMLLEQLAENPLPGDMLPDHLPMKLRKSNESSRGSDIVSVEKDASATWWGVLKTMLEGRVDISAQNLFPAPRGDHDFIPMYSEKWNEDKFEYSIVAADTLFFGLLLLKRAERLDLFNGSCLARGLVRCIFAAKTVGDRLEYVRLRVTHGAQSMETDESAGNIELELEYLKRLASSLAKCVEQLLMLCLQVFDSKENRNVFVLDQISVAIEFSGIENIQLDVLSDERSNFIAMMCNEIKKLRHGI